MRDFEGAEVVFSLSFFLFLFLLFYVFDFLTARIKLGHVPETLHVIKYCMNIEKSIHKKNST